MKSFQLGLWEAPIPSRVHDDERLIAMWLHGKSDNTRDAYFRDVLLFTDFVDKPLPQVDLADLQAYVDSLSGYRPSTRARKLSSVKSLLSFGHRLGYLRVNVGAVVKPPPVKDTLAERILDEQDVAAIIRSEPNRRNQLMLDLLYKSGMRVSELCALTWRDVRDRRGSLQVTVFGKGGRTRVILLPARLSTALARLSKRRGGFKGRFPKRRGRAPSPEPGLSGRAVGRAPLRTRRVSLTPLVSACTCFARPRQRRAYAPCPTDPWTRIARHDRTVHARASER